MTDLNRIDENDKEKAFNTDMKLAIRSYMNQLAYKIMSENILKGSK